jgi:hypothetical protein
MWKATHLVVSRIETGILMLAETNKDGTQRPGAAGAASQCRALVAIRPATPSARPARRAAAPFLAQLIAVKDQHPQTRERRRAEPQEVLAAYTCTAALTRFG